MASPTFVQDYVASRVDGFPPNNPRKLIVGTLTVDGSKGGTAGDIPASLFGLLKIERSEPLIKDDNTLIVVTSRVFDGTSLVGKAAATAALANIPSGNYRAHIFGY